MTSPVILDEIKYYIEYQEPGMEPDWLRFNSLRPYAEFKIAYDKVEKLRETHPHVKFRIEQEVHKRVILWSMEDGDE